MARGNDMTTTEKVKEQVLQAVTTNQAAMVDVVRRWAETVERLTPEVPTPSLPEGTPDVSELVDQAFEFATELLAAQRQFTHEILAAAAPALPGRRPDAEETAPKPRARRSTKSSS
jgi:hypothetical protein